MFDGLKKLKQMEKEESGKDPNEPSVIKQMINYFKILKKDKDKKTKIVIIAFVVISVYVASFFLQNALWATGKQEGIYLDPISVVYLFFTNIIPSSILSLFFFLLCNYARMYLKRSYGKDYVMDENLNVKNLENDDSYGSGHWMNEEEEQNAFYLSKDIKDITEDILGKDKEGRFVARKELRYTNKNVGVIGAPGCGKSACMVYNNIFQCIRRGESCIAIDSKGTVYKTTAHIARKAGYTVKVFNTKPDEVEFSDACNFFKIISKDRRKAPAEVNTLVTVIMHYISDPKERTSIWYTGSFNLLKAMMLIVQFSNDIPEKEKTIPTAYNILIENSVPELEAKYEYIKYDKNHPAYHSWNSFIKERDVVKESVHGGLITNLNLFQNEYIQQIISHDEIDLRKPGLEKCIYYVIIDDVDDSNNLLAALFFECACLELKKEADSRNPQELPITVQLEIDEYYSIGGLPKFNEKLSTFRSRHIPIRWYIQDISQLKQLYPGEGWRMIIACCTTMICLKAGEIENAKYFSTRIGNRTIQVDNRKVDEHAKDIIHAHDNNSVTQGKGTRPLLYPEEILGQGEKGMDDNHLLVSMLSQPPIVLEKFMFLDHPFFKYIKDEMPNEHIPAWREKYLQQDAEEERQLKARKATAAKRKADGVGFNMTEVEIESSEVDSEFQNRKNLWKKPEIKVENPQRGKQYAKSGKL